MKKVWLLFLLFFTGICFSETNLEIATRYYNKDDYENALQYYKSAVTEEHEINGTTLYRLAYTCEKTGAKKSLYSKYYSAAAYCFEKDNDTGNKYYSYAIAKEKSLGINHNKLSEDNLTDFLKERFNLNDFILEKIDLKNYSDNELVLFFIIIVVVYIIGRLFSTHTDCIIFASLEEVILLFSPWAILIILAFITNYADLDIKISTFIIPITIIMFIISAILSVRANLGYTVSKTILYIMVSFVTKVTLCIVAPAVLVLALSALPQSTKDRRYRDGTKNNQRSKNIAFITSVAFFIVFSLIKQKSRYIVKY